MTEKLSDRFFQRGRDFLGVEYPVICGAMTWVSEPNLVAAVCNAGGFGCLAGGNTPVDILEKQIDETRKLTDKPFAVNLITIAPVYQAHLEMIKRKKLDFVIFAGTIPKKSEIDLAKSTGAKVMCFASNKALAKRMIRSGTDALILEGFEAGGHIGHVSLMVLLQELLFDLKEELPVFVAGGLATGKIMAHMMTMGAAGIQMGTRFAVATDSVCHEDFKKRFFRASSREAVSSPQYSSKLPVVAVRGLSNKALDEFGDLQMDLIQKLDKEEVERHDAQLQVEEFWMGGLRRAAIEGDVDTGSLMAGQSVGLVNKEESVQDIMTDLIEGCEAELQSVRAKLI